MKTPLAALLLAATLCPQVACAATSPVMPLRNGMNTLSLTLAPMPAMAMLAHRENFNAHSFEVLTLYIQAAGIEGEPPQWQIVPVFDSASERLTLSASGGADCVLHDFRLLRPAAGQDATLILADREMGESFASPAAVQFRYFKLRKNPDGVPGQPVYRFEFDHARKAGKAYCDVGEALKAELGLGPYRPTER
jgi:hypothetical protein